MHRLFMVEVGLSVDQLLSLHGLVAHHAYLELVRDSGFMRYGSQFWADLYRAIERHLADDSILGKPYGDNMCRSTVCSVALSAGQLLALHGIVARRVYEEAGLEPSPIVRGSAFWADLYKVIESHLVEEGL